ncbi:MAG: M48 family metalloprotease [Alphaproteobacteria bacterium]|nr:M48 family metalloprotease [Alphaproteobacteria bacterium]
MEDLYPPRPEGVPADLTAPTSAYRRHAWLASVSLLAFLLLYLGLTGWFGWIALRQAHASWVSGEIIGFLQAVPAAFLFFFLAKGLLGVQKGAPDGLVELHEADEPRLFAFVHRVADDAGAPRPHRIFLSPRVNAAVFYDLSLRNLLLPTKKNLEIGIGLVNVLTLDEFKAVLAHEFGHFAQRSMAVGRWVYTSQQIAGHIIGKRDAFDGFLDALSRFDLRVAWIGWIMRLVVWSIRAVLDTAFRLILLAERALSREMELQADLVAVSVSGSDSLPHALHRLGPADDAWDQATRFVAGQHDRKLASVDLFTVQQRILEQLRRVHGDPTWGAPPAVPADRAAHRLFTAGLAQPPRMWSTHPPNHEREANAKRRYLASPFDPRSAWALFQDPTATRRRMTAHLFERAGVDGLALVADADDAGAACLKRLDRQFAAAFLDPQYRGAYLRRSAVLSVEDPAALYDPVEAGMLDRSAAPDAGQLYDDGLGEALERWRELEEEVVHLQGLADGVLTAPGGVIRHRGEELPRRKLRSVLTRVRDEAKAAREALLARDRRIRTAHRASARALSPAWEAHLVGLLSLLHYLDHRAQDLDDARGKLQNVLQIAVADGSVSSAELNRLVVAGRDVVAVLDDIWSERSAVSLSPPVSAALAARSEGGAPPPGWTDLLPDRQGLIEPGRNQMGEWLDAVDSWVDAFLRALRTASTATLETLLRTEAQVALVHRAGLPVADAPPPPTVPRLYATRCPGTERDRQKQLGWWDRFQTANGVVPGAARLAVAGGVLAPALLLTGASGDATIAITNGLAAPVIVQAGGQTARVEPFRTATLDLSADGPVAIHSTLEDGTEVEAFDVDGLSPWATYAYNVAGATTLVEWTAVYGDAEERPPRFLGTTRWQQTRAHHVFTDPPGSIETSGDGGSRTVLESMAGQDPMQLSWTTPLDELHDMAWAHARLDPVDHGQLGVWLGLLGDDPDLPALVAARIEADGPSVELLRTQQDRAGDARDQICRQHRALAAAAPDDPGLAYAAARCAPDWQTEDAAMLAGLDAHPGDGWLAVGAAYAHGRAGRWPEALACWDIARDALPGRWPQLAMPAVRARRMLEGARDTEDVRAMTVASPALGMILDMEAGTSEGPWAALHRGDLAAPLPDELDDDGRLLLGWLRAASDGADGTLPPPPDDASERGLAGSWLGLAVRQGQGADAAVQGFVDAFEMAPGDLPAEAATAAWWADAAAVEAAAATLVPAGRGQLLLAGVLIRGAEAPAAWRRDADLLLLATEKPYFAR